MKTGALEKIYHVRLDRPSIMSLERAPDVSFSKNSEKTLVQEITKAANSILASCSLQTRDAIWRWHVTLCLKENEELCVL